MLTKCRNVDAECRAFNEEWENKYFFEQNAPGASLACCITFSTFFINNFDEPMCSICNISVAENKEFNLKCLNHTRYTVEPCHSYTVRSRSLFEL